MGECRYSNSKNERLIHTISYKQFKIVNMISVVIPLYNKSHTIVNTLNTVFNQTYQDFEVVIVDDGSTDNGVEVIQQHFDDHRLRIIHQKNSGVSTARNNGVLEAKGDWIAFLDADDEWLPEYLSTLIGTLNKYPHAEMIGCSSYYKDFISNEVSANALIDKYYEKCVRINYFMNPDKMTHIGATIILKSVFIQVGGFDTNLINNEDLLLLGLIALRGNFIYIGQCLHVYVGNVNGQATSDDSKQNLRLMNSIDVLNRFHNEYYKSRKKNKLVPIYIKYKCRHLFLNLLKNEQYSLMKDAISKLQFSVYKVLPLSNFLLNPAFSKLYILYIYTTKAIWRIHGFPRVGVSSKYNEVLIKKYNMLK